MSIFAGFPFQGRIVARALEIGFRSRVLHGNLLAGISSPPAVMNLPVRGET